MAWERIEWHDARSLSQVTQVFKEIREDFLPDWLRMECSTQRFTTAQNAAKFTATGFPHRGEHFLEVE
jgi:hypothetical protein